MSLADQTTEIVPYVPSPPISGLPSNISTMNCTERIHNVVVSSIYITKMNIPYVLNKCLKQIKISILLHTCVPIFLVFIERDRQTERKRASLIPDRTRLNYERETYRQRER